VKLSKVEKLKRWNWSESIAEERS